MVQFSGSTIFLAFTLHLNSLHFAFAFDSLPLLFFPLAELLALALCPKSLRIALRTDGSKMFLRSLQQVAVIPDKLVPACRDQGRQSHPCGEGEMLLIRFSEKGVKDRPEVFLLPLVEFSLSRHSFTLEFGKPSEGIDNYQQHRLRRGGDQGAQLGIPA